ncbi:MAG: DUF6444 domain-containing protein [Candidatus Amoebophilus sp.]
MHTDLQSRVDLLEKENRFLRELVSGLQQEIQRLKEQLNLNSTNSSLPLSRDLYANKRINRVKSNRRPGGQPGHRGNTYQHASR